MKQLAKVIGRLLAVLIANDIITEEEANLIIEPLKEGKVE